MVHNFKSFFFFTCSLAALILEFPEEASMTDEKKCPEFESAITSHREAYRVARDTVGMIDAITIASVLVAVLIILMLLATSRDGVSVFLSGIAVGAIAGILLWMGTDRRSLAGRRVGGNSRTRFMY